MGSIDPPAGEIAALANRLAELVDSPVDGAAEKMPEKLELEELGYINMRNILVIHRPRQANDWN